MNERLPTVIGLCSDPRDAEEFYMPDPKPGEECPNCDRKLIHYRRTSYRLTPSLMLTPEEAEALLWFIAVSENAWVPADQAKARTRPAMRAKEKLQAIRAMGEA